MTSDMQHAVIWDMDGVIADTAQFHFRAWRSVFRSHKIGFIYEDFRHSFGQRNDTIIKTVLGPKTGPELIDALSRGKEERFRSLVSEELEAFPGVRELLRSLKKANYEIALASSAPLQNIELVLARLKLQRYFPVVVSAEDVKRGKPDPEIFLAAAGKLGVKPEQSAVIEDSLAGVAGARKAGMKCIAVTTTNTPKALEEADLIVASLKEVSVETIKSLWQR